MNAARRRALRAILAAVAGGGLTASGIGAPISSALAAEGTAATASSEGTTTAPGETSTTTTAPSATTPRETATTTTEATTTQPATPPAATTPTTTTPATKAPAAPKVVLRRHQQSSAGTTKSKSSTQTKQGTNKEGAGNNVALSPQVIAAQAAALASTEASIQALGFYRIPLFLLPIYKSAAIQYGVPWQILAAINEIETNYGTDQSVSSAGAVGWMQFMPETWLQYGVDALNSGYADPYNPVDAIFAAARYLRAAGAATNLPAAILAYNHSQEYVSSVLLRARLISAYPRAIIATLTGLVDGRLPLTGGHVAWSPVQGALPPSSSATAGATPLAEGAAAPGATAPSPTAATHSHPLQLVTVTGAPKASVVAVQNGRIAQIGSSAKLGRFVVLRDVYGDVFTYAGLGSVATSYEVQPPAKKEAGSPLVQAASGTDPTPSHAASAGFQSPLTLHVKTPKPGATTQSSGQASVAEAMPTARGKVRLFAHPGNPDARAAAAATAQERAQAARSSHRIALRVGSVVPIGTVLGHINVNASGQAGQLRFAVRPAGDPASVDPGPVLSNWAQLQNALHPQGAKAGDALLGATASDVFLLSKAELQRTVLSDPNVSVYACGRHDIASGAIDKRVLALIAFLSRSGLAPTVSGLRCGQSPVTSGGAPSAAYEGDAVEISAINGTPIAQHQGAGTITDVTLRTLLTLQGEHLPSSISSLMRYPGAAITHAEPSFWNRIRIEFPPAAPVAVAPSSIHSHSRAARLAAVALAQTGTLTAAQWEQLVSRIAALPAPTVARRPTRSAIPDHKTSG